MDQSCQEHKTTNFRVIVTFIALQIKEKAREVITPERPGSNLKVAFIYDLSDAKVQETLAKWRTGSPLLIEARDLFDAQSEFHLRVQNTVADFVRQSQSAG